MTMMLALVHQSLGLLRSPLWPSPPNPLDPAFTLTRLAGRESTMVPLELCNQPYQVNGSLFTTKRELFTPGTSGAEFSRFAHPAAIFRLPDNVVSAAWLSDMIDSYMKEDDVFEEFFLSNIIVVGNSPGDVALSQDLDQVAQKHNASVFLLKPINKSPGEFSIGPYFLTGDGLYKALKLYPDTQEAFVSSALISLDYQAIGNDAYRSGYIAVPSRLHSWGTRLPLAGLRIGVKDVIDVAGLKTGASNRAFRDFHSPKETSAPIVQQLIDLGAIVVGKTKTTQFALGEEPTADWVDEFCPFNPRGDGYQTTEGSSAGSAAAVAAYKWLDIALGTDTTGSVRLPASFQGIFGFRPTTGVISSEGIVPVSRIYDTAGFLTRNIKTLRTVFQSVVAPSDRRLLGKPTTLLYPTDYFPFPEPHAQGALDQFVERLESYLGIKRTVININEMWMKQNPDSRGRALDDYLNNTVSDILTSDSYHSHAGFVRSYREAVGRDPFISPLVRWTWEYGSKISEESRSESLRRKEVYKEWLHTNVLKTLANGNPETIMVFPFSDPAPRYRDTYREPPSYSGYSWRSDFQSPLAELPDLIIPISQYPYDSRISNTVEYLPVSIAVISAKGTDSHLISLMSDMLEETGLYCEVKTGRFAFDVATHGRIKTPDLDAAQLILD
ncbi:amidase signature enzyme [Xylaria arbuscula]|nr:amidase signature enzyme [Xylaria arbuscula]